MSVQNTIIIPKYGMPDIAYQQKYCILWDVKKDFPELIHAFPHAVFINKDFKDALFAAFTELQHAGLLNLIHSFDGCFVARNTRGSTVPSLHSWGLAMDLNAAQNGMQFHHVDNPFEHSTFTKPFVDIMLKHGLFWGGNYNSRFDPMHFSLFNG